MKRILVLFAHPALQKSRINKRLIGDIKKIENLTFHDLYQQYPEFDIDIEKEKKLLTEHDVIIFQHPFFWYSTPAILKEWQDLVLEHGWAYGGQGNALKDKVFFNLITSGGRIEAYAKDGYNRHTVRMLLAPIEQTANLCKMIYLPPYVVHGTHSIDEESIAAHKANIIKLLEKLQNDQIDVKEARKLSYLNDLIS